MASKIVEMAPNGRVVIPRDARQTLGLPRAAGQQFEVDVRDGSLVLTPVMTVRVDRTFPITADLVKSAERAAAEAAPGRSRAAVQSALRRS